MIHIGLDRRIIAVNIINDPVLDRPFKKIELTNGGFHGFLVVVGDRDTLPSAEGVETAFTVGLEFELVIVVHLESVGFRRVSLIG